MEILPEPKDSNSQVLEFLKGLMGEDGLAFLDLDNAITTVKQGHLSWQAAFAIGLHALPFLYRWDKVPQGTAPPVLALVVLELASQTHSRSKDMTVSDLVGLALEPLEARYASLRTEVPGYGLGDEQAHMLFHTRFTLGLLMLLKGDEEQGTRMLREMAGTKMAHRGGTFSSEGLSHFDVQETKALAAIILQDFYVRRQDYEMALYLLTEAVASNSLPLSESLAVVPGLLESFAEKCERGNSFMEWVGLFDQAAGITEICGEADVSGDLPSKCKVSSPQFVAWRFGQLVARFAIRYGTYQGDIKQLLRKGYQGNGTVVDAILWEGGYGHDWRNGTVVVSLLCEYDEHRNWQILRQQYISEWESSSRYQWLSLCQAGTETDLYWAVRIGFADKMLEFANLESLIPAQTEPSPIVRNIERTENIVTTTDQRLQKQRLDIDKLIESQQKMLERLPPSKSEIIQQLQQNITVWDKLPSKVIDNLVQAETLCRTGVKTDDSKVWFNKTIEACISYYFKEPVISFRRKRGYKEISIKFPLPQGKSRNTGDKIISWWSLLELSDVLNVLSSIEDKKSAIEGIENLKQTIKENYGDLSPAALGQLSRLLRDFYLRKESAHYHLSRYEEELQELEQMRELVLGTKRLSIITQIFQLFGTEK